MSDLPRKAYIERTKYQVLPRYWVWLDDFGTLHGALTLKGARRKARRLARLARRPVTPRYREVLDV